MIYLRRRKLKPSACTPKRIHASPDLPENVAPLHTLLSKENYKFVDFEAPIWDMFGNHVSMKIDKDLSFFSCHPLSLFWSEK
jgi:hypothetical protein